MIVNANCRESNADSRQLICQYIRDYPRAICDHRRSKYHFQKFSFHLAGFTLLELTIVVIILGILSALTIPLFRNSFSNLQLSNTAHNLASLMRYAQERSIVERINYQLNFNPQLSQFWLTQEQDPLTPGRYTRLSGKTGKINFLPREVKIETEKYIVNFYPDGKIDKTTIYLSDTKEHYFTITTQEQTGYTELFDYKRE
jgi:prepilin-type N-terminal cleavage/methylation domain-containing protein